MSEWDENGDGVPDGYYEAENGWQLRDALTAIVIDILRKTSAAAAVSVVSTSERGEGTVFQAYFSPKRAMAGTTIDWTGELHSLWIDQRGNLREDTDKDAHLDLTTDRILHIYFSLSANATIAERWNDNNGDCYEDSKYDEVELTNVLSIWKAGEKLWHAVPADRTIVAVVPKQTGTGYEFINFTTSNSSRLAPHLSYGSVMADVESLITYIRGTDFSNRPWRNRTAGAKVWKLADIVNSTPTFVAAPNDRYDLIYNDASYASYFQKYKNRKGVVYVGANDGCLHAINAGRYIETGNPFDRGYLDGGGITLGKELFAIIPYNLLPHLQWLANEKYCHVYYVDLKPKAFDVKCFNSDTKHPSGWGTVLVCGMRFGGSTYTIPNLRTYRSAYFALDVTDPNNVEFLWEIADPQYGFTTSYPTIARVEDKWVLVVGSGPTAFDGSSSQQSALFMYDIANPSDSRKLLGTEKAHFADPMPIDVDLDASVDVVYTGESYYASAKWWGKLYKTLTYESSTLSDWTQYVFMSLPSPITTGGASTMDDYGRLWLFFGTGRYYSDNDEADRSDQYFFGVKDPSWNSSSSTVSFADLIDITNLNIQQTDTGTYVYNYGTKPIKYDSLLVDMAAGKGWKMKLTGGERVTTRPLVIGGVVFFTTFKPNDDLCSFGGSARLYAVDFRTGVPGETSILGMDASGWLFEFVELGEGVPSAPAAHIGLTDEAMIVIQLSTGTIAQQRANIAQPRNKPIFWRPK